MSLSPEDVQDILSVLDALPVDELDLQTERFRLTLRRSGDGQWTRSGIKPEETAEHGAPAGQAAAGQGAAGQGAAGQGAAGQGAQQPAGEPARQTPAGGTRARETPAPATPTPETAAREAAGGLAEVRAPLPGTFYRAPKPGAPPFVEVGSRVGEDTVVGIIETMKMFNPVPAGLAGRVAAIELADAEFAEQDAVLMRIHPGDT